MPAAVQILQFPLEHLVVLPNRPRDPVHTHVWPPLSLQNRLGIFGLLVDARSVKNLSCPVKLLLLHY